MLEAVSIETLTARPMFIGGAWMLTRCWWTREHEVGLALLCKHKVNIERAADCLGRSPTSLVHRALDTGLNPPREWRDLVRRAVANSGPRIQLAYPYIAEVRGEHADLLAVNALVHHDLPDHMRGDVCQEIMLAIYEGTTSLEELKRDSSLVKKYVRAVKKSNYEGAGYAISLSMPMRDGRSWYDVLPDPSRIYVEEEDA